MTSHPGRSRLLDPKVLAEIGRLDLRARQVVEGYVAGLHKSPRRGYSVEFAEHREYVPGDDLRHLDWKLWAREDRYYVKQYEEETNLRCQLLLDMSESMRFGTGALDKYAYAATAAASVAYLLLRQRDAVGFRLFDDALRAQVPVSSSFHSLGNLVALAEPAIPRRKTDFSVPLREFADQSGRRSLVAVFSDFLAPVETVEAGLEHVRRRRHELILFHVLDETELTFPFEENTRFKGLEEMPDLIAEPRALRSGYLAVLEEYLASMRRICGRLRADYVLLSTGDPLDKALAGFLAARARVVRGSTGRR